MLSAYMASPRNLFRWIQSHPQGSIVGTSGSPYDCPVARFILDSSPRLDRVTAGRITMSAYEKFAPFTHPVDHMDTPFWANRFMREIDQLGDDVSVTREQALEILISLAPETSVVEERELVFA